MPSRSHPRRFVLALKPRAPAPSPALAISLIALFVALGGTAAAASGLISGKKIIDHSIAKKKLSWAAISDLSGVDDDSAYAGSPPLLGTPATPLPVAQRWVTLKSLTLPAGSYVVMARTMIGTLGTADAACDLHSQGSQIDTTWLGATSSSSELPVSLVGTVELSTGSEKIDLDCRSYQPNASANGSNIIAIKAAAVTGS